MRACNRVVSNDWFRDCDIVERDGILSISPYNIELSKRNISDYTVIEQKTSVSKGSALTRGLVGGAVLGVAGAIIGSSTAKTNGINIVAIRFYDGKDFTVEIDDNKYKTLMQSLF